MTFFWLLGGDGLCLEILIINLLVLTGLGYTCFWSAYSHHSPPGWRGGVLVSAKQLKDMYQIARLSLEEERGLLSLNYCLSYYYFSC